MNKSILEDCDVKVKEKEIELVAKSNSAITQGTRSKDEFEFNRNTGMFAHVGEQKQGSDKISLPLIKHIHYICINIQ